VIYIIPRAVMPTRLCARHLRAWRAAARSRYVAAI